MSKTTENAEKMKDFLTTEDTENTVRIKTDKLTTEKPEKEFKPQRTQNGRHLNHRESRERRVKMNQDGH